MANDDIAATITGQDAYQPGTGRSRGGPTYDQSVKIRDTGASTPPGQDARPAPFINPDPKSKHRF